MLSSTALSDLVFSLMLEARYENLTPSPRDPEVNLTPFLLIERWRQFYNEQRPHSAHRYKTPASVRQAWQEPDTIQPGLTA